MVIVRIRGGLGNQLFCFALCEKLISLGREVKIEKNYYEKEDPSIGLEFASWGRKYQVVSEEELSAYADIKQDVLSKGRRWLVGPKSTHVKEKKPYCYDPSIFQKDNIYLAGYWQTEKYFSDIRESVLDVFHFPDFCDARNSAIEEEMRNSNSVALHVRRGDYIEKHAARFGNICDKDYFMRAVSYIKEQISNPVFYIFSNDFTWAKNTFTGLEYRFIDWNNAALDDIHLMTMCKHNIIANSSFSWWGAWLNNNADKMVISPQTWVNDLKTPDIWCEGWTRL